MFLNLSAPITKSLIGGVFLSSTVVSILDLRGWLQSHLMPQLWGMSDLHLSVVWQAMYASPGEFLISILALHRLGAVERVMGSRKYLALSCMAFGLTSLLVPTTVRILAMSPLRGLVRHGLHLGLTPTIFAILYQYHALIPSAVFVSLPAGQQNNSNTDLSLHKDLPIITDNTWLYLTAAQLATCELPLTLIGATLGWIIGAMYHTAVLPNSWRLPLALTLFLDSPVRRTRRSPAARSDQHNDAHPTLAPRGSLQPPSDSDIQQLMTVMNLSYEAATQALSTAGNSMERAIENLLSG